MEGKGARANRAPHDRGAEITAGANESACVHRGDLPGSICFPCARAGSPIGSPCASSGKTSTFRDGARSAKTSTTSCSAHESEANPLFQRPHGVAQCRWRHAQPDGRPPERKLRGQGWAEDDEETTSGVTCLAVAVGQAGVPARFAVSVTVLTSRLGQDVSREDLLNALFALRKGLSSPLEP